MCAAKGAARDAGAAHLQQRRADPPQLAHLGVVDGQAGGGEVLPEHPVGEVPAELTTPPVELLARDGGAYRRMVDLWTSRADESNAPEEAREVESSMAPLALVS